LKEKGFLVPHFIVVNDEKDLTPVQTFLLDDEKTYAVRSSFSMEDGAHCSFAGQFKTKLNVSKQDIAAAVAEIKNGFSSVNVQEYCKQHDLPLNNSGRVIIQEMVDAELSGVLFTANPLGLLNEMVFVVGNGIGENVVSDKIETASYYYNIDDDVYYRDGDESAPHLDKYIIKKMVDLGKRVKDVFGYDVDVEFAIKNDHIFVLQARPITTLKITSPIVLDNSNIVESYPGVSLPLTQDFVKEIYHNIFYNLLVRITKREDVVKGFDMILKDMVDIANWRIYYRISNWYYVLKMLPFSGRIIPIWQNMLGVQNKSISLPIYPKIPLSVKWNVLRSFLFYMKTTPDHMNILKSQFDQAYQEYRMQVDRANTVDELLGIYQSIKKDILSKWDITLVNDMYTFIYTALAGKKNGNAIADFKNLESMKPVNAINELIAFAKSVGINNQEYNDLEEDYIEKFGDRCIGELKLETKTYRTNPELLREYVAKSATTFKETMHSENQKNVRRINKNIKNARVGIQNREISRLHRSKLFGLTRAIFLKIGTILTNDGRVDTTRDVFYLHLCELSSSLDLKSIVAQRKLDEQCFETIPPYTRLVFAESVFDKENTLTEAYVVNDSNTLHGTASSSGKITGEVLVIDSPSISIDSTDKIIVTKSMDPGWVFLIQHAKGIIAEKGSLLSHTAIISRELHKPAIVNVKDCTRTINTGDLVELDADKGTIKILNRATEKGRLV
jgi:pyruvate,water dikinase